MAILKIIDESHLTSLADSIRNKTGSENLYTLPEMETAISRIPTHNVGSFNIYQDEGGFIIMPMNGGGQPKNLITGTNPIQTLQPNIFYIFDECESLTINLAESTNTNVINEYHFRFTSGSTATNLTLPSTVVMPSYFILEPNKTYEISIIDNLGTYTAW